MKQNIPILIASKNSGSTIMELVGTYCGFNYQPKYFNWEDIAGAKNPVKKINPMGQVPALILSDKTCITESGAIATYINEETEGDLFLKQRSPKLHPHCLRYFFILTSNVYPTFSYSDFPQRFVKAKTAQQELTAAAIARRCELYKILELDCSKGPHFFGKPLSIIDLYLAPMVFWRPRVEWFKKNCPKLWKIATAIHAEPRYAKILGNNELR
jgi:GST-like protein